jgi:hypothetical protein
MDFRHSNQHAIALVKEILVPNEHPLIAKHVCLQRTDFDADFHEMLHVPMLTLSDTEVIVAAAVCPRHGE